jgi:hypothetical protein
VIRPPPAALAWIQKSPSVIYGNYVDPVRLAMVMHASIQAKLTAEEFKWAEIDKKMAKILGPKNLTEYQKQTEMRNTYIWVEYRWLKEAKRYAVNAAYEELSKKYCLSESAIKAIVNS